MKKYLLEMIVFIGGAAVMILEIVGARVLASYVGTSIFVWSSLIGVILACLSLGYWWGGRLADKNPNYQTLSLLIFVSAAAAGLTALFKLPLLNFLGAGFKDIRLVSVLAALILFGPASFLLATILPYAAKLKIKDLTTTGQTVGNLYALSTIGSILGTFLTGFLLIPYLGNTKIFLLASGILIFASLLASSQRFFKTKIGAILIVIFLLPITGYFEKMFLPKSLIYIDSQYNNIMISQGQEALSQRPILKLSTDPKSIQSAMYLDKDDELFFPYLRFFRLVKHFQPEIKKSLMIGGAGYSFPRDFLKKHPQAKVEVVEIDPKMTEVAKRYFGLEEDSRLAIFHQDGRVFLNQAKTKYDSIFIDTFNTYLIPYQLTTLEAVQKIFNALDNDGTVLVNIISAIDGRKGKFLQAEYLTYKKIFPQVFLFPVSSPYDGEAVQNVVLVALKSSGIPAFSSPDPELNSYLKHLWEKEIKSDVPILTDDYAPVDQYMLEVFEDI